jgi:chromosome segregation protein
MRLKCIKLAGFKSFVDPTTAYFPKNLSSVVGPNGCGKSNIIDAVRWVMGESSAKNLRGESMTDVIFNGSGGRKPVGQASIELVFDNSDGTIVGEYAKFSEISIKRKVTRESQNSYYLNGTKCRRRDITDIFLGTGLGPRSYAIIEQGMISKLIEAKPEELRVFIEEAAGISKYKERRRDTENRMRRTNENLERLTDIRDELERQLQHLKRQAASAERYTELKRDERLFKAQLKALQWRKLDDELKENNNTIRQFELSVEACVTRQTALDTEIERHIGQHGELNDHFNTVQGRFYSLGSDIARIEQTIAHQNERRQQLNQDLDVVRETLNDGRQHLGGDLEKQECWQEELLELEPEMELLLEGEELSSGALLDAEEKMQQWQSSWEEFNQQAAQARQRAEVQQSRIQQMEVAQQKVLERIARLENERNELVETPLADDVELLSEQLAEYELQQEEQQARFDELSEGIEELRESSEKHGAELDQSRGELQRQQGRYASLEALQQAALGQRGDEGALWVEQQGLESATHLAETIKVMPGCELAVETVLGDYLQAVCVTDIPSLGEAVLALDKGSVLLVDQHRAPLDCNAGERLIAGLESLSDKIEGDVGVKGLLSGIFLANNLTVAMGAIGSLQAQESIVTLDGIWLGANWLRVSKEEGAQGGVLARQQEIESLSLSIDALSQSVLKLEEARDRQRDSLQEQERARIDVQRQLKEHSRQFSELNAQLSAKKARLEQMHVRRSRAESEINEQREQYELDREHLAESRLLLQEALEATEQDASVREDLQQQREHNQQQLERVRLQARQDKDRVHQLAMKVQSLKTQIAAIQSGIARTQAQVDQLQLREQQLLESLAENHSPNDDLQLELEALLEKRLGVEEELVLARTALSNADVSLKRAEKERNEVALATQKERDKLEKVRIDRQSLEVRRDGIVAQLKADEYELDEVLIDLPEQANEREWEQSLQQLAGKISRLGAINLAAIDEYKIQSERKEYLDAQNSDLLNALEMLENAIRKIDRETRARFKETFDFVNAGLQELFPRVFGGGRAYLEMTGDDLLDTGIAIMAQPPGKRNSTIHLLSGGEKALTAIALVFSIFKLNPAPFCMLDEVDAPLDDANVGRYARMVKEMSEHVQFIYITHNKIAMEMAEHLLGVTMHEPGVSRLVTVDVEEAAELAEIV